MNGSVQLFVWLMVLLPFFSAHSQKVIIPEVNPLNGKFDNFQITDENSDPSTYSLMQDSKGFVWSGNGMGLYRFDGIRHYRYPLGQGDSSLMGSAVISIFEDSGGNIWAGTYGAVNRINQSRGMVEHFLPDTSDVDSPDNIIQLIREDRRGQIWIITCRNIFVMDKETGDMNRLETDPLALKSGIDALMNKKNRFLEDRNGSVWIATDNGLYLNASADRSWEKVFPLSQGQDSLRHPVTCLSQVGNEGVWFGTAGEGLFRACNTDEAAIEKVNLKTDAGIPVNLNTVSALYADSMAVWVFGERKLLRVNPENGVTASYLISSDHPGFRHWNENPQIDMILSGHNNTIWLINYANGLAFNFDPLSEKLLLYVTPVFVVFDAIRDNTGCLWFATVNNNIFRLVTGSFPLMGKKVNNETWAESGRNSALMTDDDGSVSLRISDGFFRIDHIAPDRSLNLQRIPVPVSGITPGEERCLFLDSRKNLWYGYTGGIAVKYDRTHEKYTSYHLPLDLTTDDQRDIRIISEDSSGNIWFATLREGLYCLARGEETPELYFSYCEMSGADLLTYMNDFLVTRNDELWVATFDGLFKIERHGSKGRTCRVYDTTRHFFSSMYVRITCDSKGNIWALNSSLGIFKYDPANDSFIRPDLPQITGEGCFTDLLIDNSDRIWIASYDRIMVADSQNRTIRDFILPVRSFYAQSAIHSSGYIIYLISNRLIFIPEEIPQNSLIPQVYLTAITINGRNYNRLFPLNADVTRLRSIVLGHHQNHLKLEYAALNYLNPERNRYRYFMTGVDRDTVETGAGEVAEYRGLAPGRHRFWVTGSNNDGVWNREGVSLDIRILAPWYRTTTAFILYTAIFLMLTSFYIRRRTVNLENERLRLEAEIRRHTAELELKNRQLAETDRIKTRFFTDIAHEIRTPLSLIMGPVGSLSAEADLNERQYETVEMINRNAHRLLSLVDQLLDISRLDERKMKINLENGDVIKYLRVLAYEFLSMAEIKSINYIVEVPDNEVISWFDRDKTEKILTNLLSNAFRFTPAGGRVFCKITAEPASFSGGQPELCVTVIDTGPGIRKEDHERIFDRFWRVEGKADRDTGGTGIGLSLVKEFTRLLHGTVSLKSEPGKGAEFTVRLPLGKAHLAPGEYILSETTTRLRESKSIATPGMSKQASGKVIPEKGKMKILIIEDNIDLRNYIAGALADTYQVIEADNGVAGLNSAMTMMPDLVVTDVLMPGLDGLTLCSRIKQNEHTSHIPIIILTARAAPVDKLKGLETGVDDYMIKPFDIDELKTRISNLLLTRKRLRLKYSRPFLSGAEKSVFESADDRFMARIVRIISDNITRFDFDSVMLHEITGMSRMHLTRKLKILTGLSPAALIRSIRLEKAAEMIESRSGNITEIANSVGLSNPAAFARSFRKYFGVSPRNYHKS